MRYAMLLALACGPALAQDILILGEVHDNPGHHLRQAGELTRFAPAAVVYEMLTPAQAQAAMESDRTPAAIATVTGWADSGWPEFDLYAPVFAAAPQARIIGAGVPRADARRAMTEGPAAVLGDARVGFAPLPGAQQASREAELQEAHCNALPEEILPGMVAAQRLRDAALALAAADALAQGGPVAVITGNGHARADWGVPAILAQVAPHARVETLGQFEAPPEGAVPFDRIAISPAPARDDPCAAFAR